MRTLIIIEKNNNIKNILPSLITASNAINSSCDVLIFGNQIHDIALDITKYKSINKVLMIDSQFLEHILVENISKQIANIVQSYTHVLIEANSLGKNLLPRVAGILQLSQISDVVKIISPNIFEKFIYAGNVMIGVESYENIKLLTIRSNNFDSDDQLSIDEIANTDKLIQINYDESQICDKINFITSNIVVKDHELTNAKIIVSGGRSLLSKENFDNLIVNLANKYHGAIGATRAAVEAGFISNDHQVGQTGKIVSPSVYIAFGVSGAVQHLAGMKGAKKVIAINNDPQAPIFEYADFGYIGDLFDVIPELLK
jgi:electron transfer flavoprotein alpha subunit